MSDLLRASFETSYLLINVNLQPLKDTIFERNDKGEYTNVAVEAGFKLYEQASKSPVEKVDAVKIGNKFMGLSQLMTKKPKKEKVNGKERTN